MSYLRHKIPPPLVMLTIGLIMWGISHSIGGSTEEHETSLSSGMLMIIFLLIMTGMGVCLFGVISFRRAQTTVNPIKPSQASSLVCSGIYQFSRNPMYLGMALFLSAWAVYLSSALIWLGPIGFILYMNQYQIKPEERALALLFGKAYTEYQSRVRRWL